MTDIIVVGGGPAGANFARLVGKKYAVKVLERKNLFTGPAKCCGGLLNEDARFLLSKLGLSVPSFIMETPQSSVLRAYDLDHHQVCAYRKEYLNISREKFDRWMLSMAGQVAEVQEASFKSAKYEPGGIRVTYVENGEEKEKICKILVGADGAFSMVRREMYPDRIAPRGYLTTQTYYQKTDNIPFYGAVFFEKLTDYYCWFIPKSDAIIVGGAFQTGTNVKQQEELLRILLRSRGINFGEPIRRDGAFLLRPASNKEIFEGVGNVPLIGEAAGFISPSSSEGISYALRSSTALAEALLEDEESFSDIYSAYATKERRRLAVKRIKSSFVYNKTRRKWGMKMGFLADEKGLQPSDE